APDVALDRVHAPDLYLACALATGDRAAVAAFEREILRPLRGYLARVHGQAAFADEVTQALRERLLISPTGAPRIASYSGRGPLAAWVRMAAIRLARDHLRARKDHVPLEALDPTPLRSAAPDPEMSYLKRRYAREFRAAFQSVLAALPPS